MLAMAPFTGVQAQSLPADDRAYFASAAAEQRARRAGQACRGPAAGGRHCTRATLPAGRGMQAQCLRHHSYLHLQAARRAIIARHRRWTR
jgi:oligoendopeptidase F